MSHPGDQKPLGDVERSLFRLYVNCQLPGISPEQLYQEYDFNYEQLAMIAGCSIPTMTRWMTQNRQPLVVQKTFWRLRQGKQ